MSGRRALLIFAKAPKPGKVKTRLLAAVSAEVAAALHAACIADTLRIARGLRGCDVLLFAAGGAEYFRELVQEQKIATRVQVFPQRGEQLGARLENAFRKSFRKGYREVVVIGTDTPWMRAGRLRAAFAALQGSDVVIGPAEDGGYYLLGMRTMMPGIFRGIPWSTARVLKLTLGVAERLNLHAKLLPQDFDLDRPEDLRGAVRMLKSNARLAPGLAAAVAQIRLQRKSTG